MANDLEQRVSRLRDEAWLLARQAMEQEQQQLYGVLREFVERTMPFAQNYRVQGNGETTESGTIPIHAVYKGERHVARYDPERSHGGWSACVWFRNDWLAPSAAARLVTDTNVNGWRFWRYDRGDGSEGMLDEIRQ